ncbi:MAG: hypothetical protein C4290_10215 [Chloroflexota bacterium]
MANGAPQPAANLEALAEQLWGATRIPALCPLIRRTAEAMGAVCVTPLPPAVEPFPPGPPAREKA